MVPIWIDLGALPAVELIPVFIASITLLLLPGMGIGSRL